VNVEESVGGGIDMSKMASGNEEWGGGRREGRGGGRRGWKVIERLGKGE